MKFFLSDNRLIAYGTLAGVMLTAGGYTFDLLSGRGAAREAAAQFRAEQNDHEVRLRAIEHDVPAQLARIESDVAWLRRLFDRRPADPPPLGDPAHVAVDPPRRYPPPH